MPIAEYTMMMILSVLRRLPELFELQGERTWQPLPAREMRQVTIGVVGLGSIGRNVARLALSFGARVIGTRKEPDLRKDFTEPMPEGLDRILDHDGLLPGHAQPPGGAGQVARRAAALAGIALVGHPQAGAAVHTGGDVDADHLVAFDNAVASAGRALVDNDLSFATTGGTGGGSLHLSQESIGYPCNLPRSMACCTGGIT